MEKFIVELRLPSGAVFRRSNPTTEFEADKSAKWYNLHARTFTAHVVPAEKYAFKGIEKQVDTPEEATPRGGFRSKVE